MKIGGGGEAGILRNRLDAFRPQRQIANGDVAAQTVLDRLKRSALGIQTPDQRARRQVQRRGGVGQTQFQLVGQQQLPHPKRQCVFAVAGENPVARGADQKRLHLRIAPRNGLRAGPGVKPPAPNRMTSFSHVSKSKLYPFHLELAP